MPSREELLEAYDKTVREVPAEPAAGAPAGAFLPGEQAAPDPFSVKQRPVIREGIASIAGEIGGEKLAAHLATGRAGRVGLAIAGAAGAAALARGAFGDGFEESGKGAWQSAGEAATGAAGGRILSSLAEKSLQGASNLKFFDADIDPRTQELKEETNKALREYYEKTAGAKIAGERRAWYNPARYFLGEGTELDNHDVTERLRNAGLNPQEARSIAENGGMALGDLSDRSLYRWLQQLSSKALWTSGKMGRFYENRAKMLQGAIGDLGESFGKPLPPELLAKAINEGLRGRYNTLELARQTGSNSLKQLLPDGWAFGTASIKKRLDPSNPADQVILKGLSPDSVSYDAFNSARQAVGSMAHDPDSPLRDRAKELAKMLDRNLQSQLPDNTTRAKFRDWRGSDDEFNKAGLDKQFIAGLSRNINGKEREVAEELLKGGNILNYHRLERALGKDSTEIRNLKAGIMERITARATDVAEGGTDKLNPAFMRRQLTGKNSIGKEYLRAIDPGIAHRYEKYADVLDRLNDTARGSGAMSFTIGESQAGGMVGLMYNLTAGNVVQAGKIAAMLTSPGYVAKAITRPDTATLLTRLAGVASMPKPNPGMFNRIAGRLLEKLPYEDALPKPTPTLANIIPSTGNKMTDFAVNPVGAIAGAQ